MKAPEMGGDSQGKEKKSGEVVPAKGKGGKYKKVLREGRNTGRWW